MAAKRIRCICGKIYDPSEHTHCPACGVEVRIESISVIAPDAAAGSQPATAAASASDDAARNEMSEPPQSVPSSPPKDLRWLWLASGAMVSAVAVFGVMHFLKPPAAVTVASVTTEGGEKSAPAKGEPEKKDNPSHNENVNPPPKDKDEPASKDKTKDEPPQKKDPKPPGNESLGKQWIVEHKGTDEEAGAALTDAIAKAGDGDTVIVRHGSYVVANLALARPVRLEGDVSTGLPPVIKSEKGAPVIEVGAKTVSIANLTLTQLVDGSGPPALLVKKEAEVALTNCQMLSRSTVAFGTQPGVSVTATKCAFACFGTDRANSTAAVFLNCERVTLMKCEFTGGENGLVVMMKAAAELKECKFHDLGLPNGKGAALKLVGPEISVTGDKCEFASNSAGVDVNGAALALTGGSFSKNGVVIGENTPALGLIGVASKGKISLTGVKFDSNRLGLVAVGGGRLEATDCQFENHGQKAANPSRAAFGNVISLTGEGSSAILRKCRIARAGAFAVSIAAQATATLEDCDLVDGLSDPVAVGGKEGSPGHLKMKRCRVTGNQGGVVFSRGSSAELEDVELRNNKLGIEARDAGTTVRLANVVFADHSVIGIFAYGQADVTATGCTFENNENGVQAGDPNEPELNATLSLDTCKWSGNRRRDVACYQKSRITLKNSTFAEGAAPKVFREPDAIVQADPPIEVTESKTEHSGKKTASTTTGKSKSGTSSSRSGSSNRSSNSSSSSKRDPGEVIRGIVDQAERIRNLFR